MVNVQCVEIHYLLFINCPDSNGRVLVKIIKVLVYSPLHLFSEESRDQGQNSGISWNSSLLKYEITA